MKFKNEYINVDIEFGKPLGIRMNTSDIDPNNEFFIKNYPFLYQECDRCKNIECQCISKVINKINKNLDK